MVHGFSRTMEWVHTFKLMIWRDSTFRRAPVSLALLGYYSLSLATQPQWPYRSLSWPTRTSVSVAYRALTQPLASLGLCIFTQGPQSRLVDLEPSYRVVSLVVSPQFYWGEPYTWYFHRSHHISWILECPTNSAVPFSVHPGNSLHMLAQAYRRRLLLLTILSASQASSTRSMSPIASASSPMPTYYPSWRR